jgi:hypothetical protein
MTKYIFQTIIFSLLSLIGVAQISTTLSINKPSATLSEWANSPTVTFVVNSPYDIPQRVIIKAELKLADGTIVATKDLSKATVFTLTRGTRIFYAQDVLPLEITLFNGSYKSTIERTGKLPSGTYQLSVQLVEPATLFGITPFQNKIFNLSAPQLPILMLPVDGSILETKKAETAIIFRWTPVTSIPTNQLQFRIQVFEILSNQQPMQALRANQPLLDSRISGQTQFIWRPQMSFSIDSIPRKFIWSIQTFEGITGRPLLKEGSGESRSEPKIFIIK